MQYRRMPIEIEAPETYGYENIDCNLSESSYADQRLGDLGISLNDLVLFYGDHLGKPALRELIASQYKLKADQILLTPGAASALFMVATALLEKGDHVIVARSNYATNIETPRSIGANISFLEMEFDKGYQINIAALQKLITPKTKFVSITYPHNPTGVSISEENLKKVIKIIEANGSYLLMDETYREMSFIPMLPLAATLSDRVISVSSMSKSYGLPGIRMGWLICQDKKLMETLLAAKEQIFITNSVVDEEIAYQYLCNKEKLFAPVKANIQKNFEVLKHFMQGQDVLEWIEPQGGCACFPRIKLNVEINTKQFHEDLLNKYSTYVGPGHWFEQDDRYMRIGYSWDKTEKLEKGMHNIVKAIQTLRTN